MVSSFEYVIDPEVHKTEEDPQEQLQLKVPSRQSPNRMSWTRRRGTTWRLKKLQLLFVIMPAHYLLMEICDLIQINLRCTLKWCQPLKNSYELSYPHLWKTVSGSSFGKISLGVEWQNILKFRSEFFVRFYCVQFQIWVNLSDSSLIESGRMTT